VVRVLAASGQNSVGPACRSWSLFFVVV